MKNIYDYLIDLGCMNIHTLHALHESVLLEAISLTDIYQKYYSDMREGAFWNAVKADPTYNPNKPDKMGKYGKWILNLVRTGGIKPEDLYKATEYLALFSKFNQKIEQKDIGQYKSLPELLGAVTPFMENPDQATSHSDEIRKIKEGAEKAYEDDTWLIVVPHTQEAACYYGKGTEWCTAATNSYNYFGHYASLGDLYVNINKKTGRKYQFHLASGQFMDETDTPVKPRNIGLTDGVLEFYDTQSEDRAFRCGIRITKNLDGAAIKTKSGTEIAIGEEYGDFMDMTYWVVGRRDSDDDIYCQHDDVVVIFPDGSQSYMDDVPEEECYDWWDTYKCLKGTYDRQDVLITRDTTYVLTNFDDETLGRELGKEGWALIETEDREYNILKPGGTMVFEHMVDDLEAYRGYLIVQPYGDSYYVCDADGNNVLDDCFDRSWEAEDAIDEMLDGNPDTDEDNEDEMKKNEYSE